MKPLPKDNFEPFEPGNPPWVHHATYHRNKAEKRVVPYVKKSVRTVPKFRKQNITERGYRVLWEWQHGRCAICRELDESPTQDGLCIDHCHTRNKVRGLLCGACNSGLGFFRDNPVLLEVAGQYLERS